MLVNEASSHRGKSKAKQDILLSLEYMSFGIRSRRPSQVLINRYITSQSVVLRRLKTGQSIETIRAMKQVEPNMESSALHCHC